MRRWDPAHRETRVFRHRSPGQLAGFLDGLTLVPPGVVTISEWRPGLVDIGGEPREVDAICGVGPKDD